MTPLKISSEEENQKSNGKVMCTVFWDTKGVIILDFLEVGANIDSDRYVETLAKLKTWIAQIRPEKKESFSLQHDNASSQTCVKTTERVTKFGWRVLPLPPYSPYLTPLDFHLFGPLKDGFHGQHFGDNKAVINAVKQWTASAVVDFYQRGIHNCPCASLAKVHRKWW